MFHFFQITNSNHHVLLKQNQESHNSLKNHTDLSAIGVDCQLLILEELDIYDLIMISQTNHLFTDLASDVFRRKHSHKTIMISGTFSENSTNSVSDSQGIIMIKNLMLSVMLFKTFGPLIQTLEVYNRYINYDQRKRIHAVISEHCSGLTSIEMDCIENELDNFPFPLRSVQTVNINGELTSSSSQFKIDSVFPAVRQLTLSYILHINSTIFDVKLPFLEGIKIILPYTENMKNTLELLFKKNEQIQSVALQFYNSFDCLKIASKYLPNLEELQFNFNYQLNQHREDEVHFRKVKKFKTSLGQANYFDLVTFDHLEEIDLNCGSSDCIRFTDRNSNVSRVNIVAVSMKDDDFLTIGRKLNELTDFSLKNFWDITPDAIITLVQESEHLRKLKLTMPGKNLFDVLKNKFTSGWHLFQEGKTIVLEKQ